MPAPFPYQSEGAAFLAARKRALLCDEMGLGKTAQAIIACDLVGASSVLILAPAAVTTNWAREFGSWQSIARSIRAVDSAEDFASHGSGVWIASYDRARAPATLNALRARRWDVLICDEAHYIKEPFAARSRSVLGPACDGVDGLVSVATYAWGLTGTPLPNHAGELWTVLCAFGPTALWDAEAGKPISYRGFARRFVATRYDEATRETKVVGVRAVADLKARMAPVLLRRKKTDVLKDLPPLREGEIALSAEGYAKDLSALEDGETGALIKMILAHSLVSDDVDRCVAVLLERASDDSISRLRRLTATVKARALAPLLAEELDQGQEKIVVFGWHRHALDTIEEQLSPFGLVRLSGDTPPKARQHAIDTFQTDPKCRVFLGNIQAAGTGITLTAAANLVFAEMSWTPSENAQAAMRIHRIGQTRPVLVRYATLAATIDEAVVRTLRRKTAAINTVLN